ncbi:MAG: PadR family transcriptional regulator [Cyanobacteriota bacterium]|nr:PadR family transcriptional regulator [Cyanobacteriota bacterium]
MSYDLSLSRVLVKIMLGQMPPPPEFGMDWDPLFWAGLPPRRRSGWDPAPRDVMVRRGDIKFILLGVLAEQPRHGYQVIKALEARHGGFYRPSPGSVYPTLQMLEEEGYLSSEIVEGKRVYQVTEAGRALLAERQTLAEPDPLLMGEGSLEPREELLDLRETMQELKGAVRQVAHPRQQQKIAQVRQILQRAKREIYGLLAEDS